MPCDFNPLLRREEPKKLCIFIRVSGRENIAAQAMLFDLTDNNAVYAPLCSFVVNSPVCQPQIEGRRLFNMGFYAAGAWLAKRLGPGVAGQRAARCRFPSFAYAHARRVEPRDPSFPAGALRGALPPV